MSGINAFITIAWFMADGALICLAISDEHPVGAIGFGGVVGFVVGLIACSIANHFMTKNKNHKNPKEA